MGGHIRTCALPLQKAFNKARGKPLDAFVRMRLSALTRLIELDAPVLARKVVPFTNEIHHNCRVIGNSDAETHGVSCAILRQSSASGIAQIAVLSEFVERRTHVS